MTYRSYKDAPVGEGYGYTNEEWGYAQTYMANDILALQTLYGPNWNTNNTNTIYAFDPITGEMLVNAVRQGTPGGEPEEKRIFLTIWDGGGVDTYDFSTFTNNQIIDLTPGGFSLISSAQLACLDPQNGIFAQGNVYNAYQYHQDPRSLMENAIGGSGNDKIIGNDANNVLQGNRGEDLIDGKDGRDVAIYTENYSDGTPIDWWIDLNPSQLQVTDAFGNWDNYQLAKVLGGQYAGTYDCLLSIEDLKLGGGNDWIFGNGESNEIFAGAGDDHISMSGGTDYIYGEGGNDTAIFQRIFADYTVVSVSGTNAVISGNGGYITCSGVENFQFADVAKTLHNLLSPTDTTGPVLVSTWPEDNQIGVPITGNIVLNFNEPIERGQGNVVIHKSDGTLITIAIGDTSQAIVNGGTLTIDPAGNLTPGSDYFVTIDAGAIRDAAGNAFVGITSSSQLNFATQSAPNTNSIFLSIFDNSVLEGVSGTTTLSFGVTLSGAGAGTQTVSVQYMTEDIVASSAKATAGQDYIPTSGVLVIPAGQNHGTINVSVIGDGQQEPDEVFRLVLSQPSVGLTLLDSSGQIVSSNFATGFITNDDQAPNRYPITGYDLEITAPGTPVLMDVLANDYDPDGDAIHVQQIFGATAGATYALQGDRVLVTPDPGFNGVLSYQYVVEDSHGAAINSSFLAQVIVSGDGTPGIINSGTNDTDAIVGQGGNDVLSGGFGDDVIAGGLGSDRIDGGPGFDYLDLRDGAHGANLQFRDPWTWDDGDGGHDILTGIEGILGTPYDDFVDGSSSDIQHISTGYRFYGYDGKDSLKSDAGDDLLDGGEGDDTLIFGTGRDVVAGGPGHDSIYSIDGYADPVGDILDGGPGDDYINGTGVSSDIITGGDGQDTIVFGDGDTVSGGNGADIFYINSGGHNPAYHATITDLAAGDQIQWRPQTPIISDDGLYSYWFGGPITQGTGASTGLNRVEFSTSASESTLYFGYDLTPGADYILTIPNTITLDRLQAIESENLPLIINVLGTNPTNLLLSNASVFENSPNGTLVGSLLASDPDPK